MSMQQPSANGIADLYRGNPQPLQQRIQKEQQAKPGLPPDLQKMLALQIVTNEKDGFAAQKAMDQLRQMGGQQGGSLPTVMQSLEQQAKQKMEAQAVQAQQKQQGLQALMQQAPAGGVPEGTPQPEMQPEAQGIDQSDRVAFAGAEGGIVAFSGEKRSDVPDEGLSKYADAPKLAAELGIPVALYRQIADVAARTGTSVGEILKTMGKDVARTGVNAVKSGARAAMTAPAGIVAAGGIPATQFAGDVVRAASPEQRKAFYDNPMMGAMSGDTGLASAIMNASEEGKQQRARTQDQIAASARSALNKADAPIFAQPGTPTPPPADLKALAAQRAAAAARANASKPVAPPPPPPPPAAPALMATPEPESDAMKMQKARLTAKPETAETSAMEKYERAIGAPDTSQYDRLVEELNQRKKQFDAPKDSWGRLSEYLGKVAEGGAGRKWYEAGAQGSAALEALNKDRKLQQFELTKQALEVSQKKLDTVRAYAKDKYGVGKAAFDQVYKDQFDAAKEIVKDEQEARKLAQQNTLKLLELKNNLDVETLRGKNQIAAASVRGAGAGGEDKQQLAELKALQKQYADQMAEAQKRFDKAEVARVRPKLEAVEAAIAKMAGLGTMGAAPGAGSPGGIPSDVQALLNKYGGK